jgi:hypothetical protein
VSWATSSPGPDAYLRTLASAHERLQSGERVPGAAFAVLELTPRRRRAIGEPGTASSTPRVRNLPFPTADMITYLIVEHERRGDTLLVTWAETADRS